MAALVFERAQQKQQQPNQNNNVGYDKNDDSTKSREISVRWLFYLSDKNALIKQKRRCQCRRRQLLSTVPTATSTTPASAFDHLIYASEMRQFSAAALSFKENNNSVNRVLERTTATTFEAKTKTDSFAQNLWRKHFQRNDESILKEFHKKYSLRWQNILYKLSMNFKPNQKATKLAGKSQLQTGASSTYLTYFILKFTQLCLIIIFLMSLLTTATQIAQQVNCLELTKSLPTTTTANQMNNNKTPFKKNVDTMPAIITTATRTRINRNKIESNMEILTSIYFENRTRTTKIENETKNNNKNKTNNSYSQFFSSYKNDKNISSSHSLSSKSNKKNTSKNSKYIQEIEQSKRYLTHAHINSRIEQSISGVGIGPGNDTNKTLTNLQSQHRDTTTTTIATHQQHQQDNASNKESANDIDLDIVKLTKLVMEGLGLKKLPDMRKVNISQQEYTSKYMEYLHRIQMHKQEEGGNLLLKAQPPTLLTITVNSTLDISEKRWRMRRKREVKDLFIRHRRQRHSSRGRGGGGGSDMTTILLKFPFNGSVDQLRINGIDEANIRLMIMYSPSLAMKRHGKHQSRKRKPLNKKENVHRNGGLCIDGKAEMKNENGKAEMNQTAVKKIMPKKTQSHLLNLKVFHNGFGIKRKLLDMRKIRFESTESDSEDETRSQWLDFDVTSAVRHWLERNMSTDAAQSLGLEVQCDNCKRIGARILNDVSPQVDDGESAGAQDTKFQLMPVLNIIGREVGLRRQMHAINEDASHAYEQQTEAKKRKGNNCYKPHQRCCRRRLDIVFKEIKGFEFIIQPKVFDAGYCEGRCPPRHNPAHHHALLQSLIWKQDHKRAPRPCCAPSKLVKLEVLHVDEKDSDKLKISTWSDMQVIECACS